MLQNGEITKRRNYKTANVTKQRNYKTANVTKQRLLQKYNYVGIFSIYYSNKEKTNYTLNQ